MPPLQPLLWYFIHSCSLPYVIYYFIFGFIFCFINNSTFLSYLSLVVGGGGGWWWGPLEATEASSRAQILARVAKSTPLPIPPGPLKLRLFGEIHGNNYLSICSFCKRHLRRRCCVNFWWFIRNVQQSRLPNYFRIYRHPPETSVWKIGTCALE